MKYFILTYTGKPIGSSGESCDTVYDISNACKICGTGAQIEGKLRSKRLDKIKQDIFQTEDGDYIISEKLYNELTKDNIKIEGLKNVVDIRNNDLPFFHLYSDLHLPKASKYSGLIVEDQCLSCKRNGYWNDAVIGNLEKGIPTKILTVELNYNTVKSELLRSFDILSSWEHMGLSNLNVKDNFVIRYARPLLIVSESLKMSFECLKLKNLKFEPIIINRVTD